MAITTKQQRQQRRNEALQLIADGVPPTDAASQLTAKWGGHRLTWQRLCHPCQANDIYEFGLSQDHWLHFAGGDGL